MSYIGKTPLVGNYRICDALTASATADYTLQVGGANVSPQTANAMIVSLNGVIQGPGASGGFTVSGSTISFNSALTSSDVIDFIYIFGDVLDIGTPTDDSVTTAKIADNNVTLAKLADGTQGDILYYGASGAPARLGFGTSGDFLKTQGTGANPTWATAAGGKIGQVLQTVNTSTETISSTTPTTISNFTVAITPAATSSKILVFVDAKVSDDGNYTFTVQLFRDTTLIYEADAAGTRPQGMFGDYGQSNRDISIGGLGIYLDSPSTTSAVDYSCKWFTEGSRATYLNRTVQDNNATNYDIRTASSITVMEVLA